jgi:hypothetical protein
MKQAVAALIAMCVFLSACGKNDVAPAARMNQATAQPAISQDVALPTNLPPPAQEPTMDPSEPTRASRSPIDPTQPQAQASPEPAAQPSKPTRPVFQATPIAPEPAATSGAQGATPAPPDSAMVRLVSSARADLAKRRGVAVDAIEVVEVRSVTWPDPSLGCPQPGMAYKQVPVDGVLIRLRVDGTIFDYHGGGGRAPFLCE